MMANNSKDNAQRKGGKDHSVKGRRSGGTKQRWDGSKPKQQDGQGVGKDGNTFNTDDGENDKSHGFRSKSNPERWYERFKEYAQQATRITTSVPLGAKLDVFDTQKVSVAGYNSDAVPGVMRLGFVPVPGYSTNSESPMNQSGVRFFSALRSVQKASGKYDYQDMIIMNQAMDSIYLFATMCARAYGVINSYSPLNNYLPKALLHAMGFDWEDLVKHINDFNAWINQFQIDASQYVMPDLDLFARHQWMVEGYYVDSTSTRAQAYVFVPDGFWQYDNTVTTGSQLKYVPWVTTTSSPSTSGDIVLHTFQEVTQIGAALLNAISNDDDFGYISGDQLAYYGMNSAHKLPVVGSGYVVTPSYDTLVLSMIENATPVGYFMADNVIQQNPNVNAGYTTFQPKLLQTQSGALTEWKKPTVNFHFDSPTEGNVFEATRFIAAGGTYSGGVYTPTIFGSELVTQVKIYTRNWSTTSGKLSFNITGFAGTVVEMTSSDYWQRTKAILDVSQFDWAPMIWVAVPGGSDPTALPAIAGCLGDIDNYTPLANWQLENIHRAALYSLFDAPTHLNS